MYILEESISEIIISKSQFITYLKEVNSIDEYKEYLATIKKKHYDATHHCSALILDNTQRSSDDGEPSGTAGVPILNSLTNNNLNHVACIVVRYFGGIKLGAGGLIRAYSKASSSAIEQAKKYELKTLKTYLITVSYDITNKLEYLLKTKADIQNINYHTEVDFYFACEENIDNDIAEITRGLKPTYLKDIYTKSVVK